MDVVITGRHAKLSSSLHDFIREKVTKLARFFGRIHEVRVTIDRHGDRHSIELTVSAARGARFAAHAVDEDLHAAINLVEARVESQIRRYKERLQSHRVRRPVGVEV